MTDQPMEQTLIANRKLGFKIPLQIQKNDPEGVIFQMMTTVGAKIAESVVSEWRHDKRRVNVNITVTMEDDHA